MPRNRMRSRGGKRGFLKGKKYPGRTQTALTFRSKEGYLPQKFVTCHVYQQDTYIEVPEVTPPIVTAGARTFQISLINIGRPEPTGPFERVNGFTQMNLLYKQWRVNYSHITIRFLNYLDDALLVCCVPRSDADPFSVAIPRTNTIAELSQQPYARNKLLGVADGGKPMATFSYGCNPSALLGRSVVTGDEGEYSGTNTTGPSENMMYNVWVENPQDNESGGLQFSYTVFIKYYVTWWDRKVSEADNPDDMLALTGGITIMGKPGKEEKEMDVDPEVKDQNMDPVKIIAVPPASNPKTLELLAKLLKQQVMLMTKSVKKKL